MSVQQEVMRALARPEDFRDVPKDDPHFRRKTSGLVCEFHGRRNAGLRGPGTEITVPARWPGDIHTFAKTFAGMLK